MGAPLDLTGESLQQTYRLERLIGRGAWGGLRGKPDAFSLGVGFEAVPCAIAF
jgi:hypothetical protein